MYMLTAVRLRAFSSTEHQSCLWYLECPRKFAPADKEEEKAKQAPPFEPIEDLDDLAEDLTILSEPVAIVTKKGGKKAKS